MFAPLTGLEVQSTRIDGAVLVVVVKLNVNLRSLTIEEVIAKRYKMLADLCQNLGEEVEVHLKKQHLELQNRWGDRPDEAPPTSFSHLGRLPKEAAGVVNGLLKVHILDREKDYFNRDAHFLDGMNAALRIQKVVLGDPQALTIEKIRMLDINQNDSMGDIETLTSFPTWMATFRPILHSLDLFGCSSMTSVPDVICELVHLRILNLGGWVSLEYLPDWIEELKELTTLRLYNCTRLTVLPAAIGRMPALRDVGLTACSGLLNAEGRRSIDDAKTGNPQLNFVNLPSITAAY